MLMRRLLSVQLATGYATSDYDTRHAFSCSESTLLEFSVAITHAGKDCRRLEYLRDLNAHTGSVDSVYILVTWMAVLTRFLLGRFAGGFEATQVLAGPSRGLHGQFKPNYRSNASAPVEEVPLLHAPNRPGGVLFTCLFPNPPVAQCPAASRPRPIQPFREFTATCSLVLVISTWTRHLAGLCLPP